MKRRRATRGSVSAEAFQQPMKEEAHKPSFFDSGVRVEPFDYGSRTHTTDSYYPTESGLDADESRFLWQHGASSDIGPSASQVGRSDASRSRPSSAAVGTEFTSVPSPRSSARESSASGSRSQALMAKQSLVNDQLRTEVDNLRRDLERIREGITPDSEVLPSYTDV